LTSVTGVPVCWVGLWSKEMGGTQGDGKKAEKKIEEGLSKG